MRDELRAEILTEFKQVYKLAPADYTENCTNVVMSIIRTEKLKLLAEVRERVVGENINETNMGDTFKVNYARGWNISKAGIRAELTKLEAEL